MMKRILLAALMLAMSMLFQNVKAYIVMPCNGAFYTDEIRVKDKDLYHKDLYDEGYFKVPFKAWFDFPASFCHLRITMPSSLRLVREYEVYEDYKGYEPGEDIIMHWVDGDGNERVKECDVVWHKFEESYIKNGEELDVYDLVIYFICDKGSFTLWEPVSFYMPGSHYKMFTLYFTFNDEAPNGKIGDIEITSYMVNYSNVSPGDPVSSVDYDGLSYYTHYWISEYGVNPCGDTNGDGEVNISDVNNVVNLIFNHGNYSGVSNGDVNQDGSVDIIDLEMVVELILSDAFYTYGGGYYYKGHKIEEGHSKVTVKRLHVNDLNGDDSVDVGDVVKMIDDVLGGNTSDLHDVNGDGSADVADVIELIEAVLNGY